MIDNKEKASENSIVRKYIELIEYQLERYIMNREDEAFRLHEIQVLLVELHRHERTREGALAETRMRRPRFIQIVCGERGLFALDDKGGVWSLPWWHTAGPHTAGPWGRMHDRREGDE